MDFNFNHEELWSKCLDIVKDIVPESNFSTWLLPIIPLKYQNEDLLVQVPTHFFFEHIETNFSDVIGKSLQRITGKPTRLLYKIKLSDNFIDITPEQRPNKEKAIQNLPPNSKAALVSPFEQLLPNRLDPQLNSSFHFGNFIAGNSNKLSRTAGVSIAESPGKTIFNPLFIYGKSGVGKTHLLHAIGNHALYKNPELRVLYVSSHLFQVQYSQAYLNNSINAFTHFYQSIDLLLIDDIHELSGKQGTQNVFFHIFNHLHQNSKQLVLTCDRAPKDLQGVEDRLLTRFKWGLTAEITQPDYQLRLDILMSKIQRDGLEFPEEVVEYIAHHAKDNIRDLEGIVVSLMAHSIIIGKNVDLELCKQVVDNSIQVKERPISVELIENEVCKYYKLEPELIQTRSKKQEVAHARQIAMYLSKKYTDSSYARIGELLGKRNHATVIHACKTVNDWIETDKSLRSDIQTIEKILFQ
ncbi:MAG: chromosomal replication initiator protein DnaA [Bacteroidales bacterium]|nr:chromosomal replication initiator protein DnaA [Bacteroidales bacterium]